MINPQQAKAKFDKNLSREIITTIRQLENSIDEHLTTQIEFLEKGVSQSFKMKKFAQEKLIPCRYNSYYINSSDHINETIAKHYREQWWDAKISKNSDNIIILTISILKKEDK